MPMRDTVHRLYPKLQQSGLLTALATIGTIASGNRSVAGFRAEEQRACRMSDANNPLKLEPLPPGPPTPREQHEAPDRRLVQSDHRQSANPHRFTDTDFSFEADFRGEELTYIEGGRRATMTLTWSNGYKVYSDSLTCWTNADRNSSPVSDEERAEILHRAVKHAREVQNVIMMVMK